MRWIVSFVAAALLAAAGDAAATEADAQPAAPSAEGRLLFEQKCTACHTIGQGVRIGPDLQGVTARRSREWLLRFVAAPDQLIAAKDPIVTPLVKQFNQIQMPNLALTEGEVRQLVDYLTVAGGAAPAAAPQPAPVPLAQPPLAAPQATILAIFLASSAVIALVFAWIALSTRTPATVDVKRAYGLRRVLFIVGATCVVVLLVATMPLAPYARAGARAERVVYVAARQFDFVFSDEPITSTADLAQVQRIDNLEIPAGTLVEFRVTSLDVSHGFGLYGPERQIIAQTQAMPGYFNRLLVRLAAPAQYRVFCLEYCAAGHHLMQTRLVVK
jgi:heme/copper-type cytochrome/quinol oxidase subunit 2